MAVQVIITWSNTKRIWEQCVNCGHLVDYPMERNSSKRRCSGYLDANLNATNNIHGRQSWRMWTEWSDLSLCFTAAIVNAAAASGDGQDGQAPSLWLATFVQCLFLSVHIPAQMGGSLLSFHCLTAQCTGCGALIQPQTTICCVKIEWNDVFLSRGWNPSSSLCDGARASLCFYVIAIILVLVGAWHQPLLTKRVYISSIRWPGAEYKQ